MLGPVLLYVDDIFSVSLRKDLKSDMARAAAFCRELMGPDAIAYLKTMAGRRLVTISYAVDLDTRLVYMAERNAQRAMFGYMTTVPRAGIKLSFVKQAETE